MNFSNIVFVCCCLSAVAPEADDFRPDDDFPEEVLFFVDACLGITQILIFDKL
jgi:hypothetical protein